MQTCKLSNNIPSTSFCSVNQDLVERVVRERVSEFRIVDDETATRLRLLARNSSEELQKRYAREDGDEAEWLDKWESISTE